MAAVQPLVPLPFPRDEGMPEIFGTCEHMRFNLSVYSGQEETYNPFQASMDIYSGFAQYFRCWRYLNKTMTSNFWGDLMAVGRITSMDVIACVLMTIAWTLARLGFCRFIFTPFTRAWGMRKVNAEKFPESAFKTTSYLFLWSSAIYVTFFSDHDFFFNSLSLWTSGRYRFSEQPLDLRIVYGLEASYYLHSVYATLFLDKWKRDSPVMLLHHLVTLALVCFSYAVSYLKIGILIFILDDISDVLLELAKCFAYMRVPGARFEPLWNNLATALSTTFVITWFFLRNIFHLTKVWRSSAFGSWHTMPYLPAPLWFFFNVLVGSLYLFYMYWFYFICIFIVRLWTGTMKEPDDIRDEEVEELYTGSKDKVKQVDFDDEDNFTNSPSKKGRKAD